MRRFGILAVTATVFVLLGCGAREDSSHLDGHGHRHPRPNHPRPNHSETNEDTLPGQVNGRVQGRFPSHPHTDMTPGSLCDHASEMRYPEHIKYCERDVEGSLKARLFVLYDEKYGYETTQMQRTAFKIDHLIPLCMGGSNKADNLWPQHVSIYQHTDPLEPFLCGAMSAGKIKQADAVQLILTIKQSPLTAEDELRKLEARF
jgi:hypothetical protein